MEEKEGLFYRSCVISLYVPIYSIHSCSYCVSPSPPFRLTPSELVAGDCHGEPPLYFTLCDDFNMCGLPSLIRFVGGRSAFHFSVL